MTPAVAGTAPDRTGEPGDRGPCQRSVPGRVRAPVSHETLPGEQLVVALNVTWENKAPELQCVLSPHLYYLFEVGRDAGQWPVVRFVDEGMRPDLLHRTCRFYHGQNVVPVEKREIRPAPCDATRDISVLPSAGLKKEMADDCPRCTNFVLTEHGDQLGNDSADIWVPGREFFWRSVVQAAPDELGVQAKNEGRPHVSPTGALTGGR